MKATVKQVYEFIQGINANQSTVSSLGTFVTSINQQVSDNLLNEVISNLDENSFAYKIATSNVKYFSEKQIWAISYELLKNDNFSNEVASFYEKQNHQSNAKKEASKTKLNINKENSSDVLSLVKQAGKKLAEYYSFVKSNKQFAKEFYSKNFTNKSVEAFLSI